MFHFKAKILSDGPGPVLLLRCATPADAVELAALENTVIQEDCGLVRNPGELVRNVSEWSRLLSQFETHTNGLTLVAAWDGLLVGYAEISRLQLQRNRHVTRHWLMLAASSRGMGIGSALLAALLDAAQTHPDIIKAQANVLAGNEASLALHRRFGFHQEGREIAQFHRPDGRFVDNICLYRLLRTLPGPDHQPATNET